MDPCPPAEQLQLLIDDRLTPTAERALLAHVDACSACQGRLEQLTQSTEFLGGPPRDLASASAAMVERWTHTPPPAPQRWPQVKGYEILEELGRGGMGVVYRAWKTALKRPVALKMILAGAHADPRAISRFRTEAEAVARLQHPHIVQIYDVGEHDGCPYLVLEYLDGGNLARHTNGAPQPARQAARLAETLVRAVHYAHQHGVVHRDLKPSNILLSAEWRVLSAESKDSPPSSLSTEPSALSTLTPKITDFGLAKLVAGAAAQTQSGEVMGTPSYMAPEQAGGKAREVGPATDVYALGAILYELLTGRPPFQAETPLETVRQVVQEEPVSLTRLQPRVPRDLETICLKCLQKEPDKRYRDAEALADDLGRFLAGEPIRARPIGMVERSLKWGRRRPALAALLVLSVIAGLALVIGDQRYKAQLVEAVGRANKERQRSDVNYVEALDLMDGMVKEVAHQDILQDPEEEARKQQFLEKALAYYQRLQENKDNPDTEARARLGRVAVDMGLVHEQLGQTTEAERAYRRALEWLEPLAAEFPDQPDYRRFLAQADNYLAKLYQSTGRAALAAELCEKTLALRQTLADAVPREAIYQMELAESHLLRAKFYREAGQQRRAEESSRKAVALLEPLARDHPTHSEYQSRLAESYLGLAWLIGDQDRAREAEDFYRRALGVREQLARLYPRQFGYQYALTETYLLRGAFFQISGRSSEALSDYRAALPVLETLARNYPKNILVPDQMAGALINLALLEGPSHPDQAEALLHRAVAILEPLTRSHPTNVTFATNLGQAYLNLGFWAQATGQWEAAVDWYTRSVQTLDPLYRNEPSRAIVRFNLAKAHGGQAINLFNQKRYAEAVLAWERRLEVDPTADRLAYALALAHGGDYRRATAEAEALTAQTRWSGYDRYLLASTYALAIPAVRRDDKLPAAERDRLADRYAVKAVESLRKAAATGYFKEPARVAELEAEEMLPLHPRADFREFMRSLKGALPVPGAGASR